jgi:hypothetical protein
MDVAFLSELAMAPNDDDQEGPVDGVLRDALSFVLGTTCLVMVGTCLSMWSTQRLIEQSIANIVKSDAEQAIKIERLQDNLNTLRIEQGILRGRVTDMGRRVGAP